MIDAGSALATAYDTFLPTLTYNGQPLEVFSGMAKDDSVPPYVIIGPWQPASDNTKDSFGQKGEQNLDVVTRYSGDQFSKKPARDIANLITSALKPTPTAEVLTIPGFKSWNTVIVGTQEVLPPSNTDKIYRLIVTVSHCVCQL